MILLSIKTFYKNFYRRKCHAFQNTLPASRDPSICQNLFQALKIQGETFRGQVVKNKKQVEMNVAKVAYTALREQDEIERMVKEAELHAQKDQERKNLIDTRNTADTTIYSIEKSLGEFREKIPSEVAKEIEDAIADLRSVMQKDDAEEIKAKIDAANKAVSKIGQHMSGGGSGDASSGGSQGGEQTPEAEYEEVKK